MEDVMLMFYSMFRFYFIKNDVKSYSIMKIGIWVYCVVERLKEVEIMILKVKEGIIVFFFILKLEWKGNWSYKL